MGFRKTFLWSSLAGVLSAVAHNSYSGALQPDGEFFVDNGFLARDNVAIAEIDDSPTSFVESTKTIKRTFGTNAALQFNDADTYIAPRYQQESRLLIGPKNTWASTGFGKAIEVYLFKGKNYNAREQPLKHLTSAETIDHDTVLAAMSRGTRVYASKANPHIPQKGGASKRIISYMTTTTTTGPVYLYQDTTTTTTTLFTSMMVGERVIQEITANFLNNGDIVNRNLTIPDRLAFEHKIASSKIPTRRDEDWTQDSCNDRFFYHYIPDMTCNDTQLADEPYPYFSMADASNVTKQAIACEALCDMTEECYGFSLVTKMRGNSGEPLLPHTQCRMCKWNIYDGQEYQYHLGDTPNGYNAITGVKWYRDYTSSAQGYVTRPCDKDSKCWLGNNGFAQGEICGGEHPIAIKHVEFQPGYSDSSNNLYMMSCLVGMYNQVMRYGHDQIRCTSLVTVYDHTSQSGIVECRYFDRTARTGVGSNVNAAVVIDTPMCQIPFEKANLHERMQYGITDCKDRQVVYSRKTDDAVDFDCDLVKLPGQKKFLKDVDCNNYVWESTMVQEQFSNIQDELRDAFEFEKISDWCPTRCRHITKCAPNPYLFADDFEH